MPCSASSRRCDSLARSARIAPWMRGCSVLTRPSRISGEPVTAATEVTAMPRSCEVAQRAAGRQDLEAELDETAGELVDAGLVRHRDQRAPPILTDDRRNRNGRRLGLHAWLAHRDLSSHELAVEERVKGTCASVSRRGSLTIRPESIEGRSTRSAPPASSQTKRSIAAPSVSARLNDTAATPKAVERSSKTPTPERPPMRLYSAPMKG